MSAHCAQFNATGLVAVRNPCLDYLSGKQMCEDIETHICSEVHRRLELPPYDQCDERCGRVEAASGKVCSELCSDVFLQELSGSRSRL